jgi:mRNA interferase MazF
VQRGEIWWIEFDGRRPVVVLSQDESSGFEVMLVVPPADSDISGLGIEVAVGHVPGLAFEGVLRFALPGPGYTPCTWVTSVSRQDLIERAGALAPVKVQELDDAIRLSQQRTEWTAEAAARFSEIRDTLRRQARADGR